LSESDELKQNGASNGTPENHARKVGNTIGSLASQMNVNQNKLDKMDASEEDMKAMMEACLEKMEANPGEMKSVAENQEVCNEEAAVEIIGVTEDRTRDRAVPARRKGRSHRGPTVEKRRWKGPECNNGIKDRGVRRQLRQRKEMTSVRIFRKTVELEIEKRITGPSTGLRKVSGGTLWRGWPPPKRKKRRQKHIPRKRRNGGMPVCCSGRIALRREKCCM
jgi:hypothetical protein